MMRSPIPRHVVTAIGLGLSLLVPTGLAGPAEFDFYHAYFLERERDDFQGAAELYGRVLKSGDLDPTLEAHAQARLAACQEEIAAADFARLMPPDTLVYLEINKPGEQIDRVLRMLGLSAEDAVERATREENGSDKHLTVSPVLIKALFGIRGVAAAVTGFDPVNKKPIGVAVFHPGSIEAIRGLLETALPAAAEAVKPIQGHPTYHVEDTAYVCMTSRMVVVSPQRTQIVAVLRRLRGETDESFAGNEAMAEVLNDRQDALVFFCVNAKPAMPIITGLAGLSRDLAMANAIVDLESLRWIAGRAGVDDRGVFLDLGVRLDEGHHNLAYNLMRTPPITRDTLRCVPKGAAGFVAAALGDPGFRPRDLAASQSQTPPPIIGLDFGRELFANMVDFAIYALPPAESGGSEGPAPDVAGVIRVNDPAKSQALWTQILGIASMAAGAPTTDGKVVSVGGADVRTYTFPIGVQIHFATLEDKIVVAATQAAMQRSLEAVAGGQSILDDQAFAPSLERISENTSKALFVHPARCLQVARKFMSESDVRQAEPAVAMLTDLVASVLTDESEGMFRLSAMATGLPDVGPFVARMLQEHDRQEALRPELGQANAGGRLQQSPEKGDESNY